MDENDREDRKPELTLDPVVKNMQAAWAKFRDTQLYAFHAAVPVLELACANPEARKPSVAPSSQLAKKASPRWKMRAIWAGC